MGKIRFVDTFAGIGGFRLAAEKAIKANGKEPQCVLSVEWDKDAQDTYENNFGERPQGDIRAIKADSYPDHDILIGGFPCQAFSRNGKYYNHNNMTLGDDDRNNLFLSLVDILKAKKPKAFVFENVKEISTIKNKDGSPFIETIIDSLKACGYRVWAGLVNSADHGVPQQRNRIYFTGFRHDVQTESILDLVEPAPVKCVKDILGPADDKYLLTHLWRNRWLNGGRDGNENMGIPGVLERLEQKGIRKPKYVSGLLEWMTKHGPKISRLDALRIAYDSGEWNKPSRLRPLITPVAIIYGDTPSGLPRQQDKLYSVLGISPTIATFSTPAFDVDDGWRLLTPEECGKLQAFPEYFKRHPRDAVAYRQFGNAVTVSAAAAVIRQVVQAL